MKELEKYFLINEFEDGWGMESDFTCEEQLFEYCTEVLFIPEDKIEELIMTNDGLEIALKDLEFGDTDEDWYVNLMKCSSESKL